MALRPRSRPWTGCRLDDDDKSETSFRTQIRLEIQFSSRICTKFGHIYDFLVEFVQNLVTFMVS